MKSGGRHVKVVVSGIVQGVFFRASAQREAARLGVSGFVKNQPDGSVYIEAEGSDEQLEAFITWCRHGPEMARVDQCAVNSGKLQGFKDFEIRR